MIVPLLMFAVWDPGPSRTDEEIREFYDLQNQYEEGFFPPLQCRKCKCAVTKSAWERYGQFYCVNHLHLNEDEVEPV